ncbi:type II toxin-antitoxin system VapB family antitoxin [bacterium]|nr:type II toxin-antitoxin system VapB family antitoxin [bacterium]
MRTNVVIDDGLMQEAMAISGLRTKKAAIEQGLHLLIRLNRQKSIRKYRGKLHWSGDLDAVRLDS